MLIRLNFVSEMLAFGNRLLISRKFLSVKIFSCVLKITHLCFSVVSQKITHLSLLPYSPDVVILLPHLLTHSTTYLKTIIFLLVFDLRDASVVLTKNDSSPVVVYSTLWYKYSRGILDLYEFLIYQSSNLDLYTFSPRTLQTT